MPYYLLLLVFVALAIALNNVDSPWFHHLHLNQNYQLCSMPPKA